VARNLSQVDLDPTTYYYRVSAVLLLAGPAFRGRCGFNESVAEHFLTLSATNTLTKRRLWAITGISDGPAVFEYGEDVVTIGTPSRPVVTAAPSAAPVPAARFGAAAPAAWAPPATAAPPRLTESAQRQADGSAVTPTASPTPAPAGLGLPAATVPSRTAPALLRPDSELVSPDSVRVRVTMYADAPRRELMMTTYFEYVEQGFLAEGMTAAGFPTEVAYFEASPKVLDQQTLPTTDQATGLSAGAITGIVVAGVGLVAMAAFVLLEAGALSSTAAADAAAAV